MDRYDLERQLDKLIRLHDRKVRAGIDASACQTRYDFQKADEAEVAYLEGYDAFMAEVGEALEVTT